MFGQCRKEARHLKLIDCNRLGQSLSNFQLMRDRNFNKRTQTRKPSERVLNVTSLDSVITLNKTLKSASFTLQRKRTPFMITQNVFFLQ